MGIDFIIEVQSGRRVSDLRSLFVKAPDFKQLLNTDGVELIVWGDPVNSGDFQSKFILNFRHHYTLPQQFQ